MHLTLSAVARVLIAIAVLGACSGDDEAEAMVVERSTVGDTTIVRTVSGSAWGDTARLVEEVRIGALEGPEELTFGAIGAVAVADDGSTYIFDSQAIALRKFDSTGKFIGVVGSRGQGPGEYQQLLGAHFLNDGRLAVYDGRSSRISTYAAADDKPLETWPVQLQVRMFADNSFAADTSDHFYVLTGGSPIRAGQRGRTILLRIAPGGEVVDTLDVPEWEPNPAAADVCLAPRGQWTLHASGAFVAGRSDAYSLELRHKDGRVTRIQRAVQPVAFTSGERDELEADIAASDPPIRSMSISSGRAPVIEYGGRQTVPQTKPYFRRIVAAQDGRIWVQVHAPAEKVDSAYAGVRSPCNAERKGEPLPITWREPLVWDVFETNGDYLGPVALPPRTTLRMMRGDRVWAVVRGESDEEYLVRFRLVRPES